MSPIARYMNFVTHISGIRHLKWGLMGFALQIQACTLNRKKIILRIVEIVNQNLGRKKLFIVNHKFRERSKRKSKKVKEK